MAVPAHRHASAHHQHPAQAPLAETTRARDLDAGPPLPPLRGSRHPPDDRPGRHQPLPGLADPALRPASRWLVGRDPGDPGPGPMAPLQGAAFGDGCRANARRPGCQPGPGQTAHDRDRWSRSGLWRAGRRAHPAGPGHGLHRHGRGGGGSPLLACALKASLPGEHLLLLPHRPRSLPGHDSQPLGRPPAPLVSRHPGPGRAAPCPSSEC
mgnify:CR=1 FL=1